MNEKSHSFRAPPEHVSSGAEMTPRTAALSDDWIPWMNDHRITSIKQMGHAFSQAEVTLVMPLELRRNGHKTFVIF